MRLILLYALILYTVKMKASEQMNKQFLVMYHSYDANIYNTLTASEKRETLQTITMNRQQLIDTIYNNARINFEYQYLICRNAELKTIAKIEKLLTIDKTMFSVEMSNFVKKVFKAFETNLTLSIIFLSENERYVKKFILAESDK
jgi:hypothetical protein